MWMTLLLNPRVWMAAGAIMLLAYTWNHGRKFEQRQEAARVEATNARIRAVNAREEAAAAKEAELRDAAYTDASAVLLRSGKCYATPEVADALSSIK
jgi:hypothetical protein